MRILDTWTDDRKPVSPEQIKADMPRLQAEHEKAKKEVPTSPSTTAAIKWPKWGNGGQQTPLYLHLKLY